MKDGEINQRSVILSLFCFGFILLSSSYAQAQIDLEAEFGSIFTPLDAVLSSDCSKAVDWQEGNPSSLSDEQIALFRRAYVAALSSDDDMLRSVVSDSDHYRDLYGFINGLKSLASDREGMTFLYQQRFDKTIPQHRAISERLDGFEPDVLVNIIWCRVFEDSDDIQQTGGFAYLSRIDGEWKFDSK